jgi:hypothetical protein
VTDWQPAAYDTVARARRAQRAVNDLGAGRPTFSTAAEEAFADLREILAAWNDGPAEYHEYMKAKLRREWPTLARAIDVAVSHRA